MTLKSSKGQHGVRVSHDLSYRIPRTYMGAWLWVVGGSDMVLGANHYAYSSATHPLQTP